MFRCQVTCLSASAALWGVVCGVIRTWCLLLLNHSVCLHRHFARFLRGSRPTELLPVREPQRPGEVGQVGGERGILGRSHLRPPQEHLDPRLRLSGVPRQTWLFPARHAASTPPAQIQTRRQLSQGHAVQTDRSAARNDTALCDVGGFQDDLLRVHVLKLKIQKPLFSLERRNSQ